MELIFLLIIVLLYVLLYCCLVIFFLGYGLYWLVTAILEKKEEVRKRKMFIIRDILETMASMLLLIVIIILLLIYYPENWLSWPKYVVASLLGLMMLSLPWQHRCPKCRSHLFSTVGKEEEGSVPDKCYYGQWPTDVIFAICERTCKRCGHVWDETVNMRPID